MPKVPRIPSTDATSASAVPAPTKRSTGSAAGIAGGNTTGGRTAADAALPDPHAENVIGATSAAINRVNRSVLAQLIRHECTRVTSKVQGDFRKRAAQCERGVTSGFSSLLAKEVKIQPCSQKHTCGDSRLRLSVARSSTIYPTTGKQAHPSPFMMQFGFRDTG